jgi:uncharacterized protein YndB with AHSA1/START domain
MPTFDDSAVSPAPIEEVWKLLYDPSRMTEWWAGVERVEPEGHDGQGNLTIWPEGWPDFPMPQELRTDREGRRVTISCLVSDLEFSWRLTPLDGDRGTRIDVHVAIPEAEAHRLESQRTEIAASLQTLALTAALGAPG